MIALQFTNIGGIEKTLPEVFIENLPDMGADATGYPIWNAKLQTWNGAGYDDYFWTGSVGGEMFGDPDYNNAWVIGEYGEGGVADIPTKIGDGVFVWVSQSGCTVTESGEVSSSNRDITLNPGYNLVCSPYPVAVSIQSLPFQNLPDMSADATGYPVWNAKLQTWNGAGYDDYFWTGSVGGEMFGDPDYNNAWVVGEYGEGGIADITVNVSDSFFVWLSSGSSECKLSFTALDK